MLFFNCFTQLMEVMQHCIQHVDPKISLIWKMGIVFLHRLKMHFWGPQRNISSHKNVT